jgi:hypothetical protein
MTKSSREADGPQSTQKILRHLLDRKYHYICSHETMYLPKMLQTELLLFAYSDTLNSKFYLRICFSLHIAKLSTQETFSRTVECSVKLMNTHHEGWKTKWLFSRKLLGTLLQDCQLRGSFLQVVGYPSRRALALVLLNTEIGKENVCSTEHECTGVMYLTNQK